MPQITILATGGTIAMHAQGKLSGLAEEIKQEGRVIDVCSKDSAEMRFADWRALAAEIKSADGSIIITHGTDTLEEGSFYLAEILGNQEMVFVGAMRQNSDPQADGAASFYIAARALQQGLPGTAVCVGGRLFSAWSAEKRDSLALNAFVGSAPDSCGNWIGKDSDFSPDWVRVLWIGAEMSARDLLHQAGDTRGLVLLAPGTGNIPQNLHSPLVELAEEKEIVVRSRCFSGPAEDSNYPGYQRDLLRAGIHIENFLAPAKIRVRLLLYLGLGESYLPWRP